MRRAFDFFHREIAQVHAAALVLGAAGLISRLVGIIRNRLLFAEFGAGRELDIYYAAFQIPDFMAAVFLLGAASAAILPVFQEYL
ncbi:MAG: virulence factor MviN, partial [Parcubacteria group bacterium Greene0714_36]